MGRPKKIKAPEVVVLPERIKEVVKPIVPAARQISRHRTINQIFGYKFAKYKTESETVYIKFLRDLNKIDLQRECARVELLPSDNREIMIERLLKQFRQYIASTQRPPTPIAIKIGKESRDILARGISPLV